MKEYDVKEFNYNGFMGIITGKEKMTNYTAVFVEWTSDPGIALFECSDGKLRMIPTYALVGLQRDDLPSQPKTGVLFGSPCSSDTWVNRR